MLKRPIILILFAISCGHLSFGQTKPDTIWSSVDPDKTSKLHLTDLRASLGQIGWRLLLDGEVVSYCIELHVSTSNIYSGFILPYTEEQIDSPEKPTNRVYYYKIPLSDTTAHRVYNLMKKMHIDQIPSEEMIKDWRSGLDGEMFYIENYDGSNYTSKSYWSPESVQAAEAKVINSFIEQVNSTVNMKDIMGSFYKHIPYPKFGTGGGEVGTKTLTNEEYFYYKREADKYRKENHLD